MGVGVREESFTSIAGRASRISKSSNRCSMAELEIWMDKEGMSDLVNEMVGLRRKSLEGVQGKGEDEGSSRGNGNGDSDGGCSCDD